MPRHKRGGRGGYEPRARVAARQARAWELSIAGRTQREIADELGVTQAAVSKMLHRAAGGVMDSMHRSAELHAARCIGRLDALHRELVDAWARSKNERGGSGLDQQGQAADVGEGDPRLTAQMLRLEQQRWQVIKPFADKLALKGPLEDPIAALKRKLTHLTDDELITLRNFDDKKMFLPEAARELLRGITPDELEAMAKLIRKIDSREDDEDLS
jgi:DNA-binding MarR family transcriptional regulator